MKNILLLFILSIKLQAQIFDIEGHRGCRGLKPENTIEAFLNAIDIGVNTLELDVCISNDEKVVVSHEPYMNSLFCSFPAVKPNLAHHYTISQIGKPVTKADEKILNLFNMNYEEIIKYDCGIRGNARFPEQVKTNAYKPLLTEVFAKVESYVKSKNLPLPNYNIEIKSEAVEYNISQPEVALFSELVYADIIKSITPERIILQSFDFEVLKYWKEKIEKGQYKKVKLAALVELKGVGPTFKSLGFLPDVFSPYYVGLTKGMVNKCHKKGVKVVPWTVNELPAMKKMKEIGTDGLITDYPDRAKKIMEN